MEEKAKKFLNFYSFYKLHKKPNDEKQKMKKMIMLNLYTLLPNIPEKYYIKSRIAKINCLFPYIKEKNNNESFIKFTNIIKDAILKNYKEIESIPTVPEKYITKINSIEEKFKEKNIERSSIEKQPNNDEVTITILVINRVMRTENGNLIFPIEISIKKDTSYADFCMKIIELFQYILRTTTILNLTELDNIIHIYKVKENLNRTELNLIMFNAIFLFVYYINLLVNQNYFSLENESTFTLKQNDCFIIDIYKNTVNIDQWNTDYNEMLTSISYYYKVCNLDCNYFIPLTKSIVAFYQNMFYFLSSENKLQILLRDEQGLQYNKRKIKIPKLRNLGNICYFNAGLQCILNCTSFTRYFEDNYVSHDCLNVKFDNCSLTSAFCNFINTLQNKNQLSLNDLYFAFTKKQEKYADKKQHDSGEFISDFLNVLEAELNRSLRYKEAKISEHNYLKSIQQYTKKNNSIIFDLFYGQMENIYTCDCKVDKCKCKDKILYEFFLLFHVNMKVATKEFQAYFVDCNNKYEMNNFSLPLSKTITIKNLCYYNKKLLHEKPMSYFICKVNKKLSIVDVITNSSTEIIKDNDLNDYVIYIFQKIPVEEKINFHFIIVPTVITEKKNWLKKAKDIYVPKDNSINSDIKLYSHPYQIIIPKEPRDINDLYQNGLLFLKKVLGNVRPSMKILDNNTISNSYNPYSLSILFDKNDFLPLYFNLENYITENTIPFDLGINDNHFSVKISTPKQDQILSLEECLLINSKYLNSLSKCECNQKTHINIKITKLPIFLIISLKKVKINEYNREVKLHNAVLYPKDLNMFDYVNQDIIKKEECDYELIGSVSHQGSTGMGHYSSIIKVEEKWMLCNDVHLSIVNDYYDNSSTILFYKKK